MLSNKIKRVRFINSIPLKKIPKTYINFATQEYIKAMKDVQKLRNGNFKNFPKWYFNISRFLKKYNVWEVVQLSMKFDKHTQTALTDIKLVSRRFENKQNNHKYDHYLYTNVSQGVGWINPKFTIDVSETKLSNISYWRKEFYCEYYRIPKKINKYAPLKEQFLRGRVWDNHLTESAYKINATFYRIWCQHMKNNLNTWNLALDLNFSKQEMKTFQKWVHETRNKFKWENDFIEYRDFTTYAKRKNEALFIDNWKTKLQEYIDEKNKADELIKKSIDKKLKSFKNIYKLPLKDLSVEIIKPKTKDDLKQIGIEMNICVGTANYKIDEIFLAVVNKYKVCIQYKAKEKKFIQIHTYKNKDIPKKLENKIKKEVIKWNSNI